MLLLKVVLPVIPLEESRSLVNRRVKSFSVKNRVTFKNTLNVK
jgi:hypothetical protein